MRHSAIPRCIHTPNLEFIPQRISDICTGHEVGRADGRTDGRTDSAITICLPNFFFGHEKGEFFARSSHYRWLWLLSLDNAADLLLFIHVYYCIICLWVRCLVLVLLCGI